MSASVTVKLLAFESADEVDVTYRTDAHFLRDCLSGVDIDLVELDVLELFFSGKDLKDGGDHSAWSAPSCPEVEDGIFVLRNLRRI